MRRCSQEGSVADVCKAMPEPRSQFNSNPRSALPSDKHCPSTMSTSASDSLTAPEPSTTRPSSVGDSSSALSHTANVKSHNQDESSLPAGIGRSQQASDGWGTDAEEFFGKEDGEIELVEDGRFSFSRSECPWLYEASLDAAKNSSTTSTQTASGSDPDSAVQSSQVRSNPSLGRPLDQVANTATGSDNGESRGRRLTRDEDSR